MARRASPTNPDLIAPKSRAALRELIAEYGGREVFSIGTCNADGVVEELDPIAFGNWQSVPAPGQNARPGQVLIHNHPGDDVEPSRADISVAATYGAAGVGFYIVDNQVERVRVVVKPFQAPPVVPVDLARLSSDFSPDGQLGHRLRGYEFRPQQLEMLGAVGRAFNEGRIAVVEAGTGVGKSFAYLAPAISWAVSNKRRVVISTNTINLQEQLLNKDMPDLRQILGVEFSASLIKGRGNYVSLRRLEFALRGDDLIGDGRQRELKNIGQWAKRTRDGSRSDLPFDVSEEVWEAVQSDKDDCMRALCPHFDECFFYGSRREAAAADVVIANHHLVMADVAIKRDNLGNDFAAILPPFERVVFDEAHNLEEVATNYFASETSPLAIRRQLGRLHSARDNKGAFARLAGGLLQVDMTEIYPPTRQVRRLLEGEAYMRQAELEARVDDCFDRLFYKTLRQFGIEDLGPRERRELRVTEPVLESDFWKEALELIGEVHGQVAGFTQLVERISSTIRCYPEEVLKELIDVRLQMASCATKLAGHGASLLQFMQAKAEEYCRWFEVGYVRDRPFVRLCVAPLDIAPQLRAALFARKRTIVLTSATLTVEGTFDFLGRQLGFMAPDDAGQAPAGDGDADPGMELVAQRTDFLTLGSPFDYARNCVVGIPLDVPAPNSPGFDAVAERVILDTLRISQGRAFVLFTAYRSLERVHNALAGALKREGITAMRQGEMPRHRLLETFRASPRAALFATSSFWEGVDVQGRALECLVLVKLPFKVPSTPLLEARAERIDRGGGDSFREMSLPLAVIRFKQGFGRLIRSKTDRGIVLVLDHRVATKPYGRAFLRSLPPATIIQDTTESVLEAFRGFHSSRLPG
jgi:ATP-dependent DNA helicase DinG